MEEDPLAEVGPKLSAGFTGALGGARMLMELRNRFARTDSPDDVLDPATIDDTADSRERFDQWWREQFPEWDQWYNDLLEQDRQGSEQEPSAAERADANWRNVADRHEQGNASDGDVASAAEVAERERFLEGTRGREADAVPDGYTDAAHYEREARAAAYSPEAHQAFDTEYAKVRGEGGSFADAKTKGGEAFDAAVAERMDGSLQQPNATKQNAQSANADRQFNGYGRSMLAADVGLEASEAAWTAHLAAGDAASDVGNKLPVGEWNNAADTAYQTTYEAIAGKPDPSRPEAGDSAIGKAYGEHYANKYADGWRAHMDDGSDKPPRLDKDSTELRKRATPREASEAATASAAPAGSVFELRDDVQAKMGDGKDRSASARIGATESTTSQLGTSQSTSLSPSSSASGSSSAQSSASTVAASQEGPSMPGGSPDSQPAAAQGQDAPSMPGGSASSQPDPEAASAGTGTSSSKWMDQAYPDKQPNLAANQTQASAGAKPAAPPVVQRKPPTAGRH